MRNWVNKYFDFSDWKQTMAMAVIQLVMLLVIFVLLPIIRHNYC